MFGSATLASAMNICASRSLIFAKAHAVMARFCELKSSARYSTALANVHHKEASDFNQCLFFAYAHAMLARFWALKSPMICTAASANASNRDCSPPWLVAANAHTVMVSSTLLKSLTYNSAFYASDWNKSNDNLDLGRRDAPCAMFATCRAPTFSSLTIL
eukprot:gnl/MRDRNA2_/MRDRNA2_225917_c0_seq1.p1 gnl/MRDRNA2_/MRDRNA2_225917_c0~~gnl/MRDRNA2_/MRDRNA2_225917_c0_seq1.p1  ORF type:complete len:160 (-),score=10.80 gnl/MRDRNA2_/MRDRNA2_225917_c0_seq1:165-644(-)